MSKDEKSFLNSLSGWKDRGTHFTWRRSETFFELSPIRTCTVLSLHREMEHVSAILLSDRSRGVSADLGSRYPAITQVVVDPDASRHTGLSTCFTDSKALQLSQTRNSESRGRVSGLSSLNIQQRSSCYVRYTYSLNASGGVHSTSSNIALLAKRFKFVDRN